jgi:uncharacterized membrane protein YedE/YeeE
VTVEDVMALDWPLYLQSLGGGALIGASAALFLLFDGRIAGISGIVGGLLGSRTAMTATNVDDGDKRRIRPRSSAWSLAVPSPDRT